MARQSLRKRKERYQEDREVEFEKLQTSFKHIRNRLQVGRYKLLTAQEKNRIEILLFNAIVEHWTEAAVYLKVISHTIFNLDNARGTHRKILRILREAGSRAQVNKPQKSAHG